MASSSIKVENMTDIRQSENYAEYLRSQGWIVEQIDRINYFIRKIPILGSVLKIQRPEKIDFKSVNQLISKYRPFQIIIEPNTMAEGQRLIANGYKLSKSPFLPTKTIQTDLTQSINNIFRNFSKDARYSIKRGERIKTMECSTLDEINDFYKAWKNCVNFNRYVPSLDSLLKIKKSFPCLAGRRAQNKCLFLTSHNKVGDIIGGALFTTSSHADVSDYITFYWYGFTNKEGRTSLSQYALLYQGILWAKKNGSKVFDFEGIYDERFPNKSWLGFTHFKKQFGGTEVSYPGCYTKFRFPI